MIHKLILTGEISGIIVISLVLIGLIITSIRALLLGHFDIETPFMPGDEIVAEQQASKEPWWHRSLVAFDQMINVIVCNGYPDETISAHCWRASSKGHLWGIILNKWLEWIQPDHGFRAVSGDHYRAVKIAAIEGQALGLKVYNRPDNLQLLCPNCHSQTDTFAGRNKNFGN